MPMFRMMPRRGVSVMFGMRMPYRAFHRHQRGMRDVGQCGCAEQAAQDQEEENLFHTAATCL
jgi:hypothetical protein